MTTIAVWVLVIASADTPKYHGQIDNIATKEECLRVASVMEKHVHHYGTFCMEVRKVKP